MFCHLCCGLSLSPSFADILFSFSFPWFTSPEAPRDVLNLHFLTRNDSHDKQLHLILDSFWKEEFCFCLLEYAFCDDLKNLSHELIIFIDLESTNYSSLKTFIYIYVCVCAISSVSHLPNSRKFLFIPSPIFNVFIYWFTSPLVKLITTFLTTQVIVAMLWVFTGLICINRDQEWTNRSLNQHPYGIMVSQVGLTSYATILVLIWDAGISGSSLNASLRCCPLLSPCQELSSKFMVLSEFITLIFTILLIIKLQE